MNCICMHMQWAMSYEPCDNFAFLPAKSFLLSPSRQFPHTTITTQIRRPLHPLIVLTKKCSWNAGMSHETPSCTLRLHQGPFNRNPQSLLVHWSPFLIKGSSTSLCAWLFVLSILPVLLPTADCRFPFHKKSNIVQPCRYYHRLHLQQQTTTTFNNNNTIKRLY